MAQPLWFSQSIATSSGPTVAFGFDAAQLFLRNDAARSVYVNLDGDAASTGAGSFELKSSESFGPIPCGYLSGLSLTSTESALCRVVALGW